MEYKIRARISNRHVHLTKEVYDMLFDNEISKKNDLNQIGQFAANETVTIRCNDKSMDNVRIVGPYRSYNQVEVSKNDARKLGINPPVRTSGDLDGAELVTIETEKGSVSLNCAIIADRHVHMSREDAIKYGVVDKEKVQIRIDGEKSGIIDAYIKVSDDGYLELHLDTDDGNAFLVNDNDEVTLII